MIDFPKAAWTALVRVWITMVERPYTVSSCYYRAVREVPITELENKVRSCLRISSTSSSPRLWLVILGASLGVSEIRLVASSRAMAGGLTKSLQYERNNRA